MSDATSLTHEKKLRFHSRQPDAIPSTPQDRFTVAEKYANGVFGSATPGQIGYREAFLAEFMGALTQLARPLSRKEDPTGFANYFKFAQGNQLVAEHLNTDADGFDMGLHFDPPDVRPNDAKLSARGYVGVWANEANFDDGYKLGSGLAGTSIARSPQEIAKAVLKNMKEKGFHVVAPEQKVYSSERNGALSEAETQRALLGLPGDSKKIIHPRITPH